MYHTPNICLLGDIPTEIRLQTSSNPSLLPPPRMISGRCPFFRKGFELFCDLCLADCLVTGGSAQRVVIQLKGHPTFVSDAMAKDLVAMIDLFAGLNESEYPRCGRPIVLDTPVARRHYYPDQLCAPRKLRVCYIFRVARLTCCIRLARTSFGFD